MITTQQAQRLAKRYAIDPITIFREHLQLTFLNYLYQNRKADTVCFKGGTALRLLFGSPRFSEDLDFDTPYGKEELTLLVREIEKSISNEIPGLHILPLYSGKNGIRFRITLYHPDFKFPIVVRLDFTRVKKIKAEASVMKTDFPLVILPLIYHASTEDILREKFLALSERNKGRDFFDVLYLLRLKTPFDPKSVEGGLLAKIESYPQAKLERDVRPFLPESERRILPILKDLLVKDLTASARSGLARAG